MTVEWPQETGHSHGNDHVPLNEGEKLRVGGPHKAGKRQPELPPDQENGVPEGALEKFLTFNTPQKRMNYSYPTVRAKMEEMFRKYDELKPPRQSRMDILIIFPSSRT